MKDVSREAETTRAESKQPRTLFSVLVLAFALVTYSLSIIFNVVYGMNETAGIFSRLWIPGGYLLSIMLSLVVFFAWSKKSFRIVMGIRSLAIIVVLSEPGASLPLALSFVLPALMEWSIYEPFFSNLIFSHLFIVLTVAVAFLPSVMSGITASPVHLANLLLFILFASMFSVAWCLMIFYREVIILKQIDVDRLDLAVGKLASANLGYQDYANMIEKRSIIEERKRITREIHDIIGYTLTNNIMMMEAATDMVIRAPGRVRELMDTARENSRGGLDKIRNALHILRAQEQPEGNWTALIAKLIDVFRTATGVKVEIDFGNMPVSLPSKIEGTAYNLIQEALTNSFRHGKATLVEIGFWVDEERTLIIYIRDNGGGASDITEGIGISGMRERLVQVNGSLRLDPSPAGFHITARIPLVASSEAHGEMNI